MNIYQKLSDHIFENLTENISFNDPIRFQAKFVLIESDERGFPFKPEKNWLGTNPKTDKTTLNLTDLKADDSFGSYNAGKTIEYKSFIINLLPASQSGFNMCLCASASCAATCLHSSGNIAALVDKTVSRLRKSWRMVFDREAAVEQIENAIANAQKQIDAFNSLPDNTFIDKNDKLVDSKKVKKITKNGLTKFYLGKNEVKRKGNTFQKLVIRLNGTSDLVWSKIRNRQGKTLFEEFPNIIFYDYSKSPYEMDRFLNDESFPPNYHLTASYNGKWSKPIEKTLQQRGNVAVVFGPGKTANLEYLKFPKNMSELFKNLRYLPKDVENKKNYIKQISDLLKSSNAYAENFELEPFAGQTLLPGLFHCYEVIDGDNYDARFIDDHLNQTEHQGEITINNKIHPKNFKNKNFGLIIGLVAKGALPYTGYNPDQGWSDELSEFMVGPKDKGVANLCPTAFVNNPNKISLLKQKNIVFQKVSRAIMIIRNFDARHLEKDTHVKKGKESVQTYATAKSRVDQELIDLKKAVDLIFQGKQIPKNLKIKTKTIQDIQKLKKYLSQTQIQQRLQDPDFISSSRDVGIGVNFEALLRKLQQPGYIDPAGYETQAPKTMLPTSTVKSMLPIIPKQESFSAWLLDQEILHVLLNNLQYIN